MNNATAADTTPVPFAGHEEKEVRRGFRPGWLFWVTGAVIILYILVAIFSPLIATHDPVALDNAAPFSSPSREHLMGTDKSGRDTFSRVVYGSRSTLLGAFSVVVIASVVGLLYGLSTAYIGGRFDSVMMRVLDVVLAFPSLILAILFVGVLGPGLQNAILGVGLVYVPAVTRVVRAQALIEKQQQYVAAARLLGYSNLRIMFCHIFPNTTSQLLVQISVLLPYAIVDITALSFLGLGVQPPSPDWGNMLAEAQQNLIFAPWMAIFPSLAIILLVLSWNILGTRVRQLLDPKKN